MRVIYADPGLRDNLGHHANSCRAIRNELMRRGAEIIVFSSTAIVPDLKEELQAVPLFRAYTYWQTDGDPVCGWLNIFDKCTNATVDDLQRVQGSIAPSDLIYLNSAQPAQFLALIRWVKSLPMERRPHIVIEFGTDPGVDQQHDHAGAVRLVLRDYRTDPRAMFYRFAAGHLAAADLARFHLETFDATSSSVYSTVLGRPVGVLPLPQFALTSVVSRVGRRPVTVAVLGHQRPDKGYHLMPEVARRLLAREPDIRLLLHNGAPNEMAQVQQELRAHAATEPRLILDERTADAVLWNTLLGRSDLILCPYDPARFVASYSAVATEAVANAIPLVVPARTTLSQLVEAFGNVGTCFEDYEPMSIVTATCEALGDFDVIAGRAMTAAARWSATMGVEHMVTALLNRGLSP